ncbi:alpha/beta hydrolase-fold protein [Lutibacter sp.]|uniref:alpha/beta hydrolase n=1 Tax=Lutibacter sp. TaxID=1925666 RepID=UPI001A35F515|nr:alpha/beta hydrolase-fold protein [Lutibacter sp.]MBI9042784.1 alpha/beta hydrolase [Lutibacter sp.]
MKKIVFIILLFTMLSKAQEVKVSSGKVQRIKNFKSEYVDARTIDVWLPDGYSSKEKYLVLYMNDGQSLYDAESTWNKQAWEVDAISGELIVSKRTKKFIVVGIWNNGEYRHSEYFPQKIIQSIPETTRKIIVEEQLKNKPQADNYLKFIVKELKPFIDKTYNIKEGRKNTFIAGSSMGGLISLYAICEYPEVFGGAACLSTHTPMILKEMMSEKTDTDVASKYRDYLKTNLPNPKNHKIYFDYGNQTLDSFYQSYQEKIDTIMIEKEYSSKNWITKFFPGDDHSEKSWSRRLHIPLEFLLKK